MEKYFSEIVGMLVLTEESGLPVGRILNVLVHPDNAQVLAFSLDSRFRKIIVPVDIRGWFHEIVLRDRDVIVSPDEVYRVREVLKMEKFFIGNRVYTRDGDYLGHVVDFALDVDQMMLTKIVVAKTLFGIVRFNQRIISFQNIVEVQKKKIIVKDNVAGEKVAQRELKLAKSEMLPAE